MNQVLINSKTHVNIIKETYSVTESTNCMTCCLELEDNTHIDLSANITFTDSGEEGDSLFEAAIFIQMVNGLISVFNEQQLFRIVANMLEIGSEEDLGDKGFLRHMENGSIIRFSNAFRTNVGYRNGIVVCRQKI